MNQPLLDQSEMDALREQLTAECNQLRTRLGQPPLTGTIVSTGHDLIQAVELLQTHAQGLRKQADTAGQVVQPAPEKRKLTATAQHVITADANRPTRKLTATEKCLLAKGLPLDTKVTPWGV